ncbi:hypothetical protein D7V97_36695 [Corallococcus sp. CA053C]|uniref:hypothetical protein n=1 Tax=Corallococcus sp. CA053C TaxID=2316732 RepID=UPI000EA149BF|nr:hypothetical protein [Corallococcus sp. CA053C]RKG95765.1 hypothetical protein D7V97_36695 [Corallococcus sp. CA053C]
MRRRLSSLIVPSALLLGLSACSLLVDFDPEGQPCDQGKCLEGYVCQDQVCVSGDGTPTDAGVDAGTSDAGTTDAGVDAGTTDGGLLPDGGRPDAG